jgi:hypothetical protein
MKSNLPKSVKRSLPYIKILAKSDHSVDKKEVLRNFPSFVINDIVEILYNIIMGKIEIGSKQKKCLKSYKKPLLKLVNIPKTSRKKFVYKQTGGFIGAVLPIIASLIGGIVSNVV